MADISLRSEDVPAEALGAFAARHHLPVSNASNTSEDSLHIIAVQHLANGDIFESMGLSCLGLIELDGEQPDNWPETLFKDAGPQSLLLSVTTGSAFNVDLSQHCLNILTAREAITDAQADTIRLPIHEAIANALTHGNLELGSALRETLEDFDHYTKILTGRLADPAYSGRRIDLRIDWTKDDISICVHDQGKGYEKGMRSEAVKSGRGLAIIRNIASSIDVTDGGRRISMRFAL